MLRRFCWFTLADSLSGMESLVAPPASMTPEARQRAGITDDLIRPSIGLEDVRDLQADLAYALTFS